MHINCILVNYCWLILVYVYFQVVRALWLLLLVVPQCLSMPLGGQCVDETFCSYNLQEYYSQVVNLPSHINERSIASWSYV